jgi:L-iditol 2-dehydrogenase
MRALMLTGPNTAAVEEVAPPASAGSALVRVDRAGVCGTDMKILSGQIPVAYPRVMGHEMVGRVVRPGPLGLAAEGARVFVDPTVADGWCDLCRRDRPNLCRNGGLLGRDFDGTFAELVAVDERAIHPVPESLSDDAASLLQVLSTCVHAQSMVSVGPGDTAAVVGLGVTGLLHAQLLRARGVRTVVGVARSAWKRELALASGVTALANPDEAARVVHEVTGGRGVDLAVECVGRQEPLAQAMELAGMAGQVLVYGTTAPTADGLPTYAWYYKELEILNPRAARPRDCDEAVRLSVDGSVDAAPLVTGRFPLGEAAAAFDACGDARQLKVVLELR